MFVGNYTFINSRDVKTKETAVDRLGIRARIRALALAVLMLAECGGSGNNQTSIVRSSE